MADTDHLALSVRAVLGGLPCSVTLPAGSGKTELIAAIANHMAIQAGTTLVLTHTHAGVDALRGRLRRFGVPREHAVVRTIDAWCFDLIRSFPQLAELEAPGVPNWADSRTYHQAAGRAVRSAAVQRMLKLSYRLVLIDEYQDCLIDQHDVALGIREAIPIAVLGDPLQGLFNFGANKPVDWRNDVLPAFTAVSVVSYPWRWHEDNPRLGEWLVGIREPLMAGESIDVTEAPVTWIEADGISTQNRACFDAPTDDGPVVALGQFRHDCVTVASRLRGSYTVMEALDEKVMARFCGLIDTGEPAGVANATVEFAKNCITGVARRFPASTRARLSNGQPIGTRKAEAVDAFRRVNSILDDANPRTVRAALLSISRLPGASIYCQEAWREVVGALQYVVNDADISVSDALAKMRNHARSAGRKREVRVVSRPLLVKGLEYKHTVLLDADRYTAAELYVALTRGSKSLTILSSGRAITTRAFR